MNWTCLVWGGPMLMVLIWWFVDAHKWFKGPKVGVGLSSCLGLDTDGALLQVNIEHQMFGREGNVIEGKEHDSGDSSAGSITKLDVGSDKKSADVF